MATKQIVLLIKSRKSLCGSQLFPHNRAYYMPEIQNDIEDIKGAVMSANRSRKF